MILPRRSAAAKLPPAREEVRGARIVTGLFLGFLLVASATMLSELFVGWQTVTATVTKLDAPRSCRSNRSVVYGPRERDWAPEEPGSFCGIVLTDQGSFRLPTSNRLVPGAFARESLHDSLREGCRFELRVYGYGFDLGPGAMATDRNKTLWSATPVGPCPALEAP